MLRVHRLASVSLALLAVCHQSYAPHYTNYGGTSFQEVPSEYIFFGDEGNDDRVNFGTTAVGGDMAISVNMKVSDFGSQDGARLFDLGTSAGYNDNITGSFNADGKFLFTVWHGNTLKFSLSAPALIVDEWTLITVVVVGTDVRICYNGGEVASQDIALSDRPRDRNRQYSYIADSTHHMDPHARVAVSSFMMWDHAIDCVSAFDAEFNPDVLGVEAGFPYKQLSTVNLAEDMCCGSQYVCENTTCDGCAPLERPDVNCEEISCTDMSNSYCSKCTAGWALSQSGLCSGSICPDIIFENYWEHKDGLQQVDIDSDGLIHFDIRGGQGINILLVNSGAVGAADLTHSTDGYEIVCGSDDEQIVQASTIGSSPTSGAILDISSSPLIVKEKYTKLWIKVEGVVLKLGVGKYTSAESGLVYQHNFGGSDKGIDKALFTYGYGNCS